MIKFMRDKEGNLYAVRNGKVIGRVDSVGDGKTPDKTKKKVWKDGDGK